MASGKTHQLAGLFSSSLFIYLTGLDVSALFSGVVGSLLPDIDTKHSILGRWTPFWMITKHRGFTHSLAGWVTLSVIASLIHIEHGLSFSVGYASHMFLDWLTPQGIPLKWPNPTRYSAQRRWRRFRRYISQKIKHSWLLLKTRFTKRWSTKPKKRKKKHGST